MSVIHCIYASTRSEPFNQRAFDQWLKLARESNARYGIGSLLAIVGKHYVQILEGPADNVDELFLRIASDPRHYDIQEIVRGIIPGRRFPGQPLITVELERSEHSDVPHASDLLNATITPYALDEKATLALFDGLLATPHNTLTCEA